MEQNNTTAGAHAGCFVCETALPFLRNIVPEDTRRHLRNARIEFLKGVRTLIDHKIGHLAGQEARGTHVPVD